MTTTIYALGSFAGGWVDGYYILPYLDPDAETPATTTPVLVTGYEAARANRNTMLDTIDGGMAVVLVAPRPRNGTLELLYASEGDAADAVAIHALETTFVLFDTDLSSVGMNYVIAGDVEVELDTTTRRRWLVRVPFQEVMP